jgi:hypothetical protein
MEISGQLHDPATLPPRERAPVSPLAARLGRPQSRFGRGGEEKHSFHFRELTSRNLVTILTELFHLT